MRRSLRSFATYAAVLTAVSLGAVVSGALSRWPRTPTAPNADHHVHVFSTAVGEVLRRANAPWTALTVADALAMLDSSGVDYGTILSGAYLLSMSAPHSEQSTPEEQQRVRAENDWVMGQVARHPGRLIGFCGVHPLRDYAADEVTRCARIGARGIKLHFSNSDVRLGDPGHLRRLRNVFTAANTAGLAVVVHMRPRNGSYGRSEVGAFIEQVLRAAPDIPVQITHMAGWGGYDRATDEAMQSFNDGFEVGSIARDRVFFDLSGVVLPGSAYNSAPGTDLRFLADQQQAYPEWRARLVTRIRQIGVDRVLFATDWPVTSPAAYQRALSEALDLTPAELRTILRNTAPYFRE